MPLLPELVAFQIPPFLLCGLGIQRKTLEFEVFVALLMLLKKRTLSIISSKAIRFLKRFYISERRGRIEDEPKE